MSTEGVYDEHGNKIGYNVVDAKEDGSFTVYHYDNNHKKLGESFTTTTLMGRKIISHSDANGKRIGTSAVSHHWLKGDYIGTSFVDSTEDEKFFTDLEGTYFDDSGPDPEPKAEPAADSGGSAISVIFSAIISAATLVIVGAAKAIWFIYYKIFSFLGPAPILLFLVYGPLMIYLSILVITYIPSLIAMIVLKTRNKITLNNVRTAGALWNVIGPFSWIYLYRAMKKNV